MTDTTKAELLKLAKQYAHVDFDDDDDVLGLMVDATVQTMEERIAELDSDAMKSRQKLLLCITVKDLYDNKAKYGTQQDMLRAAAASMMLSEVYEVKTT